MASNHVISVDECGVCFDLMKEPRVLSCDHSFCLKCLEGIEQQRTVTCPVCRANTTIKKGFTVKLLPKYMPKQEVKEKTVEMLDMFEVDQCVTSVAIDEYIQVVYVGRDDFDKPIERFSFDGRPLGLVEGKIRFSAPRLAIDSRRGLLLAVRANTILTFDRDGNHVTTTVRQEFQQLDDISYDVKQDSYILADNKAKVIMFIEAETHTVTRTVSVEEEEKKPLDNNIVCVASDKFGKTSTFVTTGSRSSAVRLYDGDGLQVKVYDNKGSGYGQFIRPKGVCFNHEGHIIISDTANNRLVCLSPDAAHEHQPWNVLMDTKKYDLVHPRHIDVTRDGLLAVVFWSKLDGPFKVAIFTISD